MRFGAILSAILALSLLAPPAQARVTIAARLNTVAGLLAAGPVCDQIGYQYNQDQARPAAQAAMDEAVAGGVKVAQADYLLGEAVDSESRSVQQDVQALIKVVKDAIADPVKAKALRGWLDYYVASYGRRCDAAAADPLLSKVVVAPGAPALAAAKAEFIDRNLAAARVAPWQTPHVLAQADMLFSAGACRGQLPLADYTRYIAVTTGPQPADPAQARLRRYYEGELRKGQDSAEALALDKLQCGRVVTKDLASLKAHP
jgi:hypothetical protein